VTTNISGGGNNHSRRWKQPFPIKETTVFIFKLVETTVSIGILGGNNRFPDNFFCQDEKIIFHPINTKYKTTVAPVVLWINCFVYFFIAI
jgi:hypothetical protein